jgi:hypothetical protein
MDALLDKAYVFGNTETVPAQPTGFAVSATDLEDHGLDFSWDAVAEADYYQLKMATVTGGPYRIVRYIEPTTTGAIITSGEEVPIPINQQLFWRVDAVNKGGRSTSSAEITTEDLNYSEGIPLGVVVQPGDTQNTVSWDASAGATTYDVKSSLSVSGPFEVISNNQAGLSYVDTGLTNGVEVFYTVSANNGTLDSPDSIVVSGIPAAVGVVPAVVTGLVVTPGDTTNQLTWNSASGATSYKVNWRVSGGSFAVLATITNTNRLHTSLANGTTYDYTITSTNSAGDAAASAQVSGTPTAVTTQTLDRTHFITRRPGFPPAQAYGFRVLHWLNGGAIGIPQDGSGTLPSKSSFQSKYAAALKADSHPAGAVSNLSTFSDYIIMDVEELGYQGNSASQMNGNCLTIVNWAKEITPAAKVGFYSKPIAGWGIASDSSYDTFRKLCQDSAPFMRACGILCPAFYIRKSTPITVDTWVTWFRRKVQAFHEVAPNVDIFPVFNPQLAPGSQYVEKSYFRTKLEEAQTGNLEGRVRGISIWQGGLHGDFLESEPWWQAVQEWHETHAV